MLRHFARQAASGFASITPKRGLATPAYLTTGHKTMTKIVCTLGPSSDEEKSVSDLVSNGMHVARLNFSHAGDDYTYVESNMQLVREAPGMHTELAAGSILDMPKNVRAVLVDTKGPEIRTGILQGNVEVAEIAEGATVELTTLDVSGDNPPASPDGPHRIQVDYASIAKSLSVGSMALLDDGLLALHVTEIDPSGESVTCVALNGGPIKKNKGVNLPNTKLDLPALTEKDKRDLKWACENEADYIAASFIRTPGNVRSVIAYLERCLTSIPMNKQGKIPLRPLVISKIESKEGVDNFQEILKESDGIMVARGDLGVEIPYSKVFAAQKMMVAACNAVGKPVIVATQMLDSMQRNPRPTRAEVTDVGTAVLDGADAVMLSGETAAGRYPIESIKAMTSVVMEADYIVDSRSESEIELDSVCQMNLTPQDEELDALSKSVVSTARLMNAKLIVLVSMSGKVARAIARHRPTVPVLAFCTDKQVARRLQLHRALTPVMLQSEWDPNDNKTSMGKLRAEAARTARELDYVREGDRIIFMDRTKGKDHDLFHYSHNMKISTLREI